MKRFPLIVGLVAALSVLGSCCEDGSSPPCQTVHYKVTQYDDSGNVINEWIVPHRSVWASEGAVRWSDPDTKDNEIYVFGNVAAVPFFAEEESEH